MLARQLKKQRLDQNLSILEVSIRARLDASLVSRYENGNRIPTRDHVLRLSSALALDQEALLITWLSEKLKKVWMEEADASIREKALGLLAGSLDSGKLFEATGTRITQKQEEKLIEWLSALKPVQFLPARRFRLLREILLPADDWKMDEIVQVIEEGKTAANHGFPAHLRLHGLHQWLHEAEKEGKHLHASSMNRMMKQQFSGWTEIDWPGDAFNLMSLTNFLSELNPLSSPEKELALQLCLLRWGFPLCPLSPTSIQGDGISELAENLGDRLIVELRKYRNEIEP